METPILARQGSKRLYFRALGVRCAQVRRIQKAAVAGAGFGGTSLRGLPAAPRAARSLRVASGSPPRWVRVPLRSDVRGHGHACPFRWSGGLLGRVGVDIRLCCISRRSANRGTGLFHAASKGKDVARKIRSGDVIEPPEDSFRSELASRRKIRSVASSRETEDSFCLETSATEALFRGGKGEIGGLGLRDGRTRPARMHRNGYTAGGRMVGRGTNYPVPPRPGHSPGRRSNSLVSTTPRQPGPT